MIDCEVGEDNLTLFEDLKFNIDEPPEINRYTSIVHVTTSEGAISAKTLAPFQDVEVLWFFNNRITQFEDGALGSLPNLRSLLITDCSIPILTKGILSGCQRLEKFETNCVLEEDALHEMINLNVLNLEGKKAENFSKTYLEPLKHLKILWIDIESLKNTETGLFGSSPELEELKVTFRSSLQLTQSLFDGCNHLRKLSIDGTGQAVIEGTPFTNMPHLEELELSDIRSNHISKGFLSGFPNLKYFWFRGFYMDELIGIDEDTFVNLPHLTRLNLTAMGLQDSDLEALHHLQELVDLQLPTNSINTLDSLPALPSLETLNVKTNNISKFDVSALKQKLPKLKELDLKYNEVEPEVQEELRRDEDLKVNFSGHRLWNKLNQN